MKIIIAGAGRIGSSLAEMLSQEGHDITVIDRDEETISHVSNDIDVICLEGNATNPDVLTEAGAKDADLLIAATEQDEVNMVCGISARKLGTKHVVARVRDTEYLGKTEFLREALGISLLVNPEFSCAKEISRILRFPSASRIDAFSKGSLEIVEHKVAPGGQLDGVALKDLQKISGAKVLVSLAEREGKAIIPKGDFTVKGGDMLSITGISSELRRFFMAVGAYKRPVRNVMITGGGRISVYLARILQENGISTLTIQGELCAPGIQQNRLRLAKPEWYVFTVRENGKRVGLQRMLQICTALGMETVPIEEIGMDLPAKYPTVEALLARADGEYPKGGRKEGIVVRPTEPVFCPLISASLSMKIVSNKYLLKNEA